VAEHRIDTPVVVRDNGIRSFIPPSYCFDLVDGSGDVVEVVSAIALRGQGLPDLADFDAVKYLGDNNLVALGEVAEYDAGPQAREPGRRFTVTAVAPG
jgi:hypothetical protein